MCSLNLKNLEENKTEILKAEVGALLFNLGKTHVGIRNWRRYFDIDEDKFKENYKYKTFGGYKDYFCLNKFNSRSPFIIDMDSIDEELKDFFNETYIVLTLKNRKDVEIKRENLELIDVVKGNVSSSEFINKVMFQGCENINSGIDKGAPKKQLNNLQIANAFGTIKEEITNKEKGFADLKRYDAARINFLTDLWKKMCSLGKINLNINEMRKFILKEVERWYSHLLSDSRFPVNDVTLWDQAYMTASMFKASIAALCLDGKKYDDYMKKPRSIKWSILGVQYDKLSLAEKALNPAFIAWYRNETNKVDRKIKKVIEEEFALGNEIYRDETGIYFIAPENICGEMLKDSEFNIGLYRLDAKLGKLQGKVIECFKSFNGEVFPAIFATESSRGTMNIAFLIENAKENFLKPVYPKLDSIKKYFGKVDDKVDTFKVVCDVCRVRLAEKNEDEDLNLCDICRRREEENKRTKLNDIYKETIWTGELQDKNRRIALVTMKFELDEWLNGNMLNTMITSEYKMKSILNNLKNDLKENGKKVKKTAIGSILYKGDLPPTSLEKYAESILVERSIGDKWEELLKKKLGDQINFEDRRIDWNQLKKDAKDADKENKFDFLLKILLQFATRKNPSPARFRRIWETIEDFFIDIQGHMMDILEIPEWRNVRIKFDKDKFKILEGRYFPNNEFEYKGLDFILDNGNLYLITSIEKAISILSKETIESEEKLQEIYSKIVDCEGNWMKKEIELVNKVDKSTCKIQFKPNKEGSLKTKNISYKPYLSIINPTPISWQFIVPAEYIPKLIKKVQHKYDEEFKYVKGKLPLHIGIVFQDYKKPLYIGIKALRNIRRDIKSWDSIEKTISGEGLTQMLENAINNSNSGCENRTEIKRYYSLYPLKDENKGDYSFYVRPDKLIELKSVDKAKKDDKYNIYPNTIDFEFLDVNTRRNDIFYDDKKSKRVSRFKQNRPYTWEEWEIFNNFFNYFTKEKRNTNTKLQNMVSLIYSKIRDWEDDESLKRFMLSDFINTFELRDDKSKDNFAKVFGKNMWEEIKGMPNEEFKRELYRFLDMYDFWHNGLKKF